MTCFGRIEDTLKAQKLLKNKSISYMQCQCGCLIYKDKNIYHTCIIPPEHDSFRHVHGASNLIYNNVNKRADNNVR